MTVWIHFKDEPDTLWYRCVEPYADTEKCDHTSTYCDECIKTWLADATFRLTDDKNAVVKEWA